MRPPAHPIEAELPSYSEVGVIEPVEPNKHTRVPVLKVVVSNSQLTYGLGEVIYGNLVYTPKQPSDVSNIFVMLEGEEMAIKPGWKSDIIVRRHMNLASHSVPESSLPRERILRPGFSYSFPFVIQIPEAKNLANSPTSAPDDDLAAPEFLRISPTLGSPPEFLIAENDLPGNIARISYRLRGTVRVCRARDSARLDCAYNYIHITPSYSLSPIALGRVGERSSYTSQSVIVKGKLKKLNYGVIEMQMPQLSALSMATQGAKTAPLKVFFRPDVLTDVPPSVSQITVNLVSRTIYSETGSFTTSPPSADQPGVNIVRQKVNLTKLSPSSDPWRLDPEVGAHCAIFQIPLSLPADKRIVPTFESCFITRDYMIETSLQLDSKSSPKLSVPVNIVASDVPTSTFPFGHVPEPQSKIVLPSPEAYLPPAIYRGNPSIAFEQNQPRLTIMTLRGMF